MTEPMSPFESRLAHALSRYADRAPAEVDAISLTAAVSVPNRRPRFAVRARRWSVVLGLVVLGAALIGLLAGALLLRRPPLPDGQLFVWAPDGNGGGTVHVVRPGGEADRSVTLPGVYHCPHLLPDQSMVVYWSSDPASADGLWRRGFDGTPAQRIASLSFRVASSGSWSPDGSRLAFSSGYLTPPVSGGIAILNAADGRIDQVGPRTNHVFNITWSPDGRRIAFAQQLSLQVEIDVIDRDGSNFHQLAQFAYDSGSAGSLELRWAPNQRYLAYQTANLNGEPGPPNGWQLVDVVTGKLIERSATSSSDINFSPELWSTSVASPDGTRVAVPNAGTLSITAADGAVQRVLDIRGTPQSIAWSPDGTAIALQFGVTYVVVDVYSVLDDRPPTRLGPFTAADGSHCPITWQGR